MEKNNSLFEHYSFLVDDGQSPLRIDKYLMNFIENATRSKIQEAAKNESIYVPLGSKHRLSNPGDTPLVIIEVQNGSYLGEDDIIRFEDKYGRQKEINK